MKKIIRPCDMQNGIINIETECVMCGSDNIIVEIDLDNNTLIFKCEKCTSKEEIYF